MSVFLRILLSLALVLNGTSGAWAKAPVEEAPPVAHTGHAMAAEATVPPCHSHADVASADEPAPAPAPMSEDCCQPAACQCACAHLPAAAFALDVALPEPAQGMAFEAPEASGHAAPPLPDRTRPPIV